MKIAITHQARYSRAELLLRSFFGFLYILIPHMFLLFFVNIWSVILTFIAWWAILFTGRYPKDFFDYNLGVHRWALRIQARMMNLVDGYPDFGISKSDEKVRLEVEYPEKLSRGILLLKTLFGGIYVLLPHGFLLLFRIIATYVLLFLAWWVILFTGEFPQSWHNFITGTLRWQIRVNMYLMLMTDMYPPFSGRE